MRNFAMLYKMKEALHEFRTAYNRLDPEWQEWTDLYLSVNNVLTVYDLLEEMEFDVLNLSLEEVNKIHDQRKVDGKKQGLFKMGDSPKW